MRIKLRKDWHNGQKVIPKGTDFFVTNDLAKTLIKARIAKEYKETLITELFKKKVDFETKDEYLTKKQNGNNRNSERD